MIHIHKWGDWEWTHPQIKLTQVKYCQTCGKAKKRIP